MGEPGAQFSTSRFRPLPLNETAAGGTKQAFGDAASVVQVVDGPEARTGYVRLSHEPAVRQLKERDPVDEARRKRDALLAGGRLRRRAGVPAALHEAVQMRLGLEQERFATSTGTMTGLEA